MLIKHHMGVIRISIIQKVVCSGSIMIAIRHITLCKILAHMGIKVNKAVENEAIGMPRIVTTRLLI